MYQAIHYDGIGLWMAHYICGLIVYNSKKIVGDFDYGTAEDILVLSKDFCNRNYGWF
jgi:hypothetical protein